MFIDYLQCFIHGYNIIMCLVPFLCSTSNRKRASEQNTVGKLHCMLPYTPNNPLKPIRILLLVCVQHSIKKHPTSETFINKHDYTPIIS